MTATPSADSGPIPARTPTPGPPAPTPTPPPTAPASAPEPDSSPEDDGELLWSAIAEPSRRRLIDALLTQGEASASALAGRLPFTRQAVAKNLAVLERAGLVEAERVGREVRFRVRPDRLDQATSTMARVAARWDGRMRRIKRLAEEAAPRERNAS